MTRNEFARLIDHSVLKPESTPEEIGAGAALVRELAVGFYCVQPCWVGLARDALAGVDACVVSVVGFPHGCDAPEVKSRATAIAIDDGAGEIDMVLNLGALRSAHATIVAADIEAVVIAAQRAPVKVIIESAALTDREKRLACRLAVDAGAAFVKTSTGFHPAGGATVADVRVMRETVGPDIGVKASGGIRTLDDALALIGAGANRIGTSSTAGMLAAFGESAR